MADMAARISAAAGDASALLSLAIELAQENARLAGHAAALEQAELARKEKQNARTIKHRNVAQRDAALLAVTVRDVTACNGEPPSPPSPSLLPPEPPNNSSPTPSPRVGRRSKQEPAPWMGLMAGAWTLGTIPLGSATVLRPVIAAIGEAETARRLAAYCAVTDRRFASVRDFAAKHATFAEDDAPLVANGWFTPAGERATR